MSELAPNLPDPMPQPGALPPRGRRGATSAVVMPDNLKAKTRRIMLEESDDIPPTGQYIGHNGNGYLLKPGVWVDVPLPLLEVLDHAVMSTPQIDPNTRRVVGYREKLRYPYRVAPGQ
jgi:hypothetical protein